MDQRLPEPTDDCNVCDEEPMQGGILRCSVCKNQFYCSRKCQNQDWLNHKFNCSLLPPNGLSPAQFEDRDELRAEADRVSALLIEWKKAYDVYTENGRNESKKAGWQLPEARPIKGLEISPRFPYPRFPQDHQRGLFRMPLVLATRILFMDLIATLPSEMLDMMVKRFNEVHLPSEMPQLYGPKMVARPGDLSPGEYEMLGTVLGLYAFEGLEIGEKDRWTSLTLAMNTLFNVLRAPKKSRGPVSDEVGNES